MPRISPAVAKLLENHGTRDSMLERTGGDRDCFLRQPNKESRHGRMYASDVAKTCMTWATRIRPCFGNDDME